MFKFEDGLILYHGSYCEVSQPDLSMCSNKKDFGKGFYLTSSKEQAENFLKTSLIKAKVAGVIDASQDYGYISTFEFIMANNLKTHIYEEANTEWLHCITAHRKNNLFNDIVENMATYDIIIGKIADDATNSTLTAYIGGAFGMIGSKEADDFCIKQLLPNKLKDQYCFKTNDAIRCLTFVEAKKIWIK